MTDAPRATVAMPGVRWWERALDALEWSLLAVVALLGGVLGRFVAMSASTPASAQFFRIDFAHIALAGLVLVVCGRMAFDGQYSQKMTQDATRMARQAGLWGLLVVWAALSVMWAAQEVRAAVAVVLLLLEVLLGLYIAVQAHRGHMGALCALVAIAAVPHALLGMAQYANGDALGLVALGEKPWNPADPHGFGPEPFRSHGLAAHPNGLSGYLALAVMLSAVWAYVRWRGTGRWAAVVVGGVCFAGLLTTASRTAILSAVGYVGLAAVLVTLTRYGGFSWRRLGWAALGAGLLATLGVLAVWWVPAAGFFWERMQIVTEWWYITERFTVGFPKTLAVWAERPLLGTGLDGLRPALLELPPDEGFSLGVLAAHNVYVVVLAELGALGLGLFAAALWFPLRRLWAARGAEQLILLALLTVCVMMLWDYYFWHGYPLRALVLWLSGLAWEQASRATHAPAE